ncbi:hypothetical protein DFH28DRAFT_1052584 [Melampsora americana]|nr:hypothetical protein DFH28DRAFT_1052584 [Melampsora americana]
MIKIFKINKFNPFINPFNSIQHQFHTLNLHSNQIITNSIPNQIQIKHPIQNQHQNQNQNQNKPLIKFKEFLNKPSPERIPKPHHEIETVESFLNSLKRPNLIELKSKFQSWDEFFKSNRISLKSTSINPKERKYLLWSMERFRHGQDPKEFSIKLKKKKTIRGWGPRVQNGKRLRGKVGGRITI